MKSTFGGVFMTQDVAKSEPEKIEKMRSRTKIPQILIASLSLRSPKNILAIANNYLSVSYQTTKRLVQKVFQITYSVTQFKNKRTVSNEIYLGGIRE